MRVIAHVLARLHRDQRGSVLLFVIGFLPIAFAAAALVIDVANGAEHRRHLQLQADAGALAAAQDFSQCFLDENAANDAIEADALSYSGTDYNPQVGAGTPQSRVQQRINATSYTTASFSDGDPCDTGFVDVKLTEAGSPPLFAFLSNHDFRAHARVKIFKLQSSNKLLPIAVPDPEPRAARVTYVDEATGTVLASSSLSRNGTQNGLSIWESPDVAVPITAQHVGVRVALSGDSATTTCGQNYVSCFDLTSGTRGLVHLRGWTAAGTATAQAPIARSVSLVPGTCPDATFVNAAVSCTIGVNATVDFGAAIANPVTTLGATVSATVAGTNYPLTYNAGTKVWSANGAIPVPPQTGPRDVALHWQITKLANGSNCNGNSCRGDITQVHRTFSALAANSGPIGLAQVTEAGVMTNSFQRCSALLVNCTHNLKFTMGTSPGLDLSDLSDPPVRLRVIGGSQNQSLDCDPALSNLKSELAQGCKPAYRPHETTDPACPGSTSALWARPNPPPWDCVAVQTGNATNQIADGLNTRVFGTDKPSSCTQPNHWPNYPPGDPRIIFVIVTPFGAFQGSGSTTVPVVRFAAFYMTGWTGNGSGANPCIGHGDEPPTDSGEIVGRFIKYIDMPNNGGAGGATCDFSAIDPCTAVLVE
jgi:Putative Flp pilus-assembly TadE/G-like